MVQPLRWGRLRPMIEISQYRDSDQITWNKMRLALGMMSKFTSLFRIQGWVPSFTIDIQGDPGRGHGRYHYGIRLEDKEGTVTD